MKRKYLVLPIILTFWSNQATSLPITTPYNTHESKIIEKYLLENTASQSHPLIKKQGDEILYALPGATIASPSSYENNFVMDYQLHWTRDAALSMREIVYLYDHAAPAEKTKLRPYLLNYVNFEYALQQEAIKASPYSLGEPKYHINGSVWLGKWARPQNDGPGLRAITLIAIAKSLLKEQDTTFVSNTILPMLRLDLNYVAKEWHAPSYDLWEELKDTDHFFNKIVQRKALYLGAKLFSQLKLASEAIYFNTIVDKITASLALHWNANRGYYIEALHSQDNKGGGLDSSILLGLVYGNLHQANDPFALDNEKSLSTVYHLTHTFGYLYKINQNQNHYQLIGRYSNDIYDGNQFVYGNPWNLTSSLLAEYYYSLAKLLTDKKTILITENNLLFYRQFLSNADLGLITKQDPRFQDIINKIVLKADSTLAGVKTHGACYDKHSCYHLSEQIDRASGKQVSARDLTWGYATVLTALQARGRLQF